MLITKLKTNKSCLKRFKQRQTQIYFKSNNISHFRRTKTKIKIYTLLKFKVLNNNKTIKKLLNI